MTEQTIEQLIQEKGLTAPRVTMELIQSKIKQEYFFTAQEGYWGQQSNTKYPDEIINGDDSLNLLTFCVLVLENGFTVTGESACASPENFDPEIGKKIAKENAINKIWFLEGYLLKEQLSK